jgi:hypothetical protein
LEAFEQAAFEVALGIDGTNVGARPRAGAAVLDALDAALEVPV